jgi:2-(1,2-epoxy-1,2-dihydrophenyl)acetyl-CoA isomerase
MSDELLLVERQGAVALLTLNNPTRLNSLVRPLRDALAQVIPSLAADPDVRAVVITGAGRGFCSGGDFSQPRDRARPVQVHRDMAEAHHWIRALLGSETLVVTAVNGPAAGAGFGLAMMGDVVFASDQAFFKAGFPTIGVSADYMLGWTLPRAIGTIRAFDIVTSNRRVEAAEAERIGMITRVVPHDGLLETALETARTMAAGPYSLGLTKRLVRRAHDLSLEDYMQSEVFSFALATASDDYAAGGDAFRRKEAPVFLGR